MIYILLMSSIMCDSNLKLIDSTLLDMAKNNNCIREVTSTMLQTEVISIQ